ncbi:hypothetical protein SK069_06300 [Patulibacter brassicae]|uniref:Peptidase M23 domain-containing protein n=1 Tax=Patulibacter brassicae TaxID=1705717 RepID=A0ABU4VHA7_9ACTN|nr:hypothetical protein [Patulibacter brassicae]MDX8151195.1 hypothetical protein [Patulibacter brassicae]
MDAPPALVRPVDGPVTAGYRYDRRAPFRRGRRRVVRFSVPAGAPVRAPCTGRVTFSGRTPRSRTVTVRCGAWAVTVSGVAPGAVARGRRATAGQRLGRAGGRTVALGVRRPADPFGYVDPTPLLAAPRAPRRFVPLGPAPRGRLRTPERAPRGAPAPRGTPLARVAPPVAPADVPTPSLQPAPGAAVLRPGDRPAPPWAWVGLALAAVGLPGLALGRSAVRRAARTRRHSGGGAAASSERTR